MAMNKQPKRSQEIFFFKDYLIEKYGYPLYRVSIDLPFSCPNRNVKRGGGCIFCAEDGARARHLKYNLQLEQQIADSISYIQQRYSAKAPYIAYFQSFTNTYAPVAQLRELYERALMAAEFKIVIISTRPDCLPEPVINYLAELNERYELWIELGVQSANDQTLALIQRGHNFSAVEDAVKRLAARGIKCAAHVILGLPGENMVDYRNTAEKLAALPFAGIKIHNLLVLKKTALAKMFANANAQPPVIPLNEYEYAKALAEFLSIIPANWPVMRLTADADTKQLIAPKWWMKKGQFLEFFKKQYRRNAQTTEFIVSTADGSPTLYHPEYRQHFHSLAGAAAETENKFILPCQLTKRLTTGDVKLLDIGFGLGYNAIGAAKQAMLEYRTPNEKQGTALEETQKSESLGAQNGKIHIITLEKDRSTLVAAKNIFPAASLEREIITTLLKTGIWRHQYATIELKLGDARQEIQKLKEHFDCIFMDGFSPDKNPELWSFDFIRQLTLRLKQNGVIATYSSAYPVRGAMLKAGLTVGESPAFGRRRGGTVAAFSAINLAAASLPEKELDIIMKSTAGVPYFDRGLGLNTKTIFKYRNQLVSKLRQRGIPKWYKRLKVKAITMPTGEAIK
jgi:radical SAM protein (TIGR01212 family)